MIKFTDLQDIILKIKITQIQKKIKIRKKEDNISNKIVIL